MTIWSLDTLAFVALVAVVWSAFFNITRILVYWAVWRWCDRLVFPRTKARARNADVRRD